MPGDRKQRAALVFAVLGALAGCASSIPPTAAPPPEASNAQLVKRGAELAALGDCAGCHTRPGGPAFSGGVPLQTSFGTIYGTNITPDVAFGIGTWSEQAFRRALREGVSRDGHLLYPAFPYDHFTRLNDGDIKALYAFLMSRDAVPETPPKNRLIFPFNLRTLIAGWKALYFKPARFAPDASKNEQWNRGAYLVEGLGHCGACHTPRNRMGAEQKDRRLAGAMVEGWYAPALNEASPSPIPWTQEDLATYLSTGIAHRHAIAAGPMQGVTAQLGRAAPADVQAIAAYINSAMGPTTPEREARAKAALELAKRGPSSAAAGASSEGDPKLRLGASLYVGACASCHEAGRGVSSNGALELPLAVAIHDPEPASLVNIIRDGIRPPEGERGRWMPGFAGAFNQEQLEALVAYLRTLK